MSEIKLKSCPFCGSEKILYISEKDYFGIKNVSISCLECHISQTGDCETKEEAIEKWNTRKPMDEIVERLEEERKKLPHVQHWTDNDKVYKNAIEIVKGGVENEQID